MLSLSGCASRGGTYSFVVREPVQAIYWIEIQWQANSWNGPEWKARATAAAEELIKAEMTRLRLPHSTIYAGQPVPYEGTWIVVFATTSDLPEAETRDRIAEFQKTQVDGQRPPPAIYQFRGKFRKEMPNQRLEPTPTAVTSAANAAAAPAVGAAHH